MFPPIVRWILIAGCLLVAIVSWQSSRTWSYLLLGGAAIIALGHWRYGSVYLAFRAYRAGRMERMERLLGHTSRPELLAPAQRVVFEYLSGIAADRRGDLAAARRHFFFATIDRKHNRLRAHSFVQLAHTELLMGDVAEARRSLAQAREIAKPELANALRDVERAIEESER